MQRKASVPIGKARKHFFFEKKKQKTFVSLAGAADTSDTA
jgi:hypothetical protein